MLKLKKCLNNSDDNFIFGYLAKTLNGILITVNAPKELTFYL